MAVEIVRPQRIWSTFSRNRTAVAGGVIALAIILVAAFAPWISPHDPLEQDPLSRLSGRTGQHWLGTDDFGRDVFSRIIWGSRVSLLIGGASVALGMLLGTAMGMIAGYYGGRSETSIMRSTDVMMCFPDLILAIAVTAAVGANLVNLIITIGIVLAPRFARLSHGIILSLKQNEYVLAARTVGAGGPRILLQHILPNIFGDLLVAGSLWVGESIRLEANLAFIGLGVQPPTPTWGNMTRDGIEVLINAPWIAVYSGLCILVAILAFNMLGDGIRDVTDPKLRGA